ncbi:hypothetical protein QCA50_005308 [Cerrena zonata]|uniref:Uncharacterized protein n=1 Tax=Cerrena zonata TaxID=2478898 RepID=A0AAW0GEG1_9APHY
MRDTKGEKTSTGKEQKKKIDYFLNDDSIPKTDSICLRRAGCVQDFPRVNTRKVYISLEETLYWYSRGLYLYKRDIHEHLEDIEGGHLIVTVPKAVLNPSTTDTQFLFRASIAAACRSSWHAYRPKSGNGCRTLYPPWTRIRTRI